MGMGDGASNAPMTWVWVTVHATPKANLCIALPALLLQRCTHACTFNVSDIHRVNASRQRTAPRTPTDVLVGVALGVALGVGAGVLPLVDLAVYIPRRPAVLVGNRKVLVTPDGKRLHILRQHQHQRQRAHQPRPRPYHANAHIRSIYLTPYNTYGGMVQVNVWNQCLTGFKRRR